MRTDSTQRQKQADRLRAARAAAGFSTAAAAIERFSWKQSTYLAHENGQNGISADYALAYGKKYKVDPGWLLTGLGKGPGAESKPRLNGQMEFAEQEFTRIGRYDASFSAGPGSLVAEHPEPLGYWLVETQWLNALTKAAPQLLAIVRVDGDSMTPTLADGDWVLIDKQQTRMSREGIYAIRVGDDAWVKRLSLNLRDKTVRIISDNPAIPVQDVDETDLAVLGRVIALVARKVA